MALAGASDRADWLGEAGWGVMVHFLPDWIDPEREWTSEEWTRQVDGFDVETLGRQLRDAGAGYLLFSIGQNSGFYASPNATYDRLVGIRPGRCSRRDLVGDLSEALGKRGIRLLVYLPAGPPAKDPAAVRALDWRGDGHPNREFQSRWEQVIREWSRRWGAGVAGWWFDGCARPNTMYRSPDPPNFASFAAAARAGNEAAIVAFSPGLFYPVFSQSPHDDYTAGLIYDFERSFVSEHRLESGKLDGARLHVLSFLGETWGRGEPRFSAEEVVACSRKVLGYGGAVTWDVPVGPDGVVAEPFFDRLRAVGREAGRFRGGPAKRARRPTKD